MYKLTLLALIFSFQFHLNADEAGEIEDKIDLYLSKMSVSQKVGQLFMVEIGYITPEEVRKYSIGAVLNGGGSFLTAIFRNT